MPATGAQILKTDLVLPLGFSIVQKNGRLGPSVYHLFEHVVQFLHIQIQTKAPNNKRRSCVCAPHGFVLRKALDDKANFKL